MSQDWMKFEKATLEKPEVFRMATSLGVDRDSVIGKLLRVWSYFDTQTIDGVLKQTSKEFLDNIVGQPGFAAAMISVRWLIERRGSLVLPNFDRHNGETAKQRALSAKRMQRNRERQKDGNGYADVTQGPSPEESRGEKKNPPLPPKGGKRRRSHPTAAELQAEAEAKEAQHAGEA